MSAKRSRQSETFDETDGPPPKRQRSCDHTGSTSYKVKFLDLKTKYNAQQVEISALRETILTKAVGVAGGTKFPDIEEFVQAYTSFINQTHSNLLSVLLDVLEEILLDDAEEDIDMHCEPDSLDIETIELQQIAHQILHSIVIKCYHAMRERKRTFYAAVEELLHMSKTKQDKASISMFADAHLQSNWDSFVHNKHFKLSVKDDDDTKECFNLHTKEPGEESRLIAFDHSSIDSVVETIFSQVKDIKESCSDLTIEELFALCANSGVSANVHRFIAEACVLFWIMMLYKQPRLSLSHDTFWIQPYNGRFSPMEHSMSCDDIKEKQETVQFCGVPGIVEQMKRKDTEKKRVLLIEPHLFMHSQPKIVSALVKLQHAPEHTNS